MIRVVIVLAVGTPPLSVDTTSTLTKVSVTGIYDVAVVAIVDGGIIDVADDSTEDIVDGGADDAVEMVEEICLRISYMLCEYLSTYGGRIRNAAVYGCISDCAHELCSKGDYARVVNRNRGSVRSTDTNTCCLTIRFGSWTAVTERGDRH